MEPHRHGDGGRRGRTPPSPSGVDRAAAQQQLVEPPMATAGAIGNPAPDKARLPVPRPHAERPAHGPVARRQAELDDPPRADTHDRHRRTRWPRPRAAPTAKPLELAVRRASLDALVAVDVEPSARAHAHPLDGGKPSRHLLAERQAVNEAKRPAAVRPSLKARRQPGRRAHAPQYTVRTEQIDANDPRTPGHVKRITHGDEQRRRPHAAGATRVLEPHDPDLRPPRSYRRDRGIRGRRRRRHAGEGGKHEPLWERSAHPKPSLSPRQDPPRCDAEEAYGPHGTVQLACEGPRPILRPRAAGEAGRPTGLMPSA